MPEIIPIISLTLRFSPGWSDTLTTIETACNGAEISMDIRPKLKCVVGIAPERIGALNKILRKHSIPAIRHNTVLVRFDMPRGIDKDAFLTTLQINFGMPRPILPPANCRLILPKKQARELVKFLNFFYP
ncbi:MAG: hypothetical protein V1860_02505 [bacterium]